jgi:2-phospho-L-lactate guanylyltransferase
VRLSILVPVKTFADAKVRLAPALSATERAELARRMATHVLGAAGGLPVAVVCDADDVAAWAAEHGAEVIWCPGLGLNGAVAEGVRRLAAAAVERVIVAHADLPMADDLGRVAQGFDGVTLVPDRRDDGTNVLCVPTGAGFEFAYGSGSFARHRAEAERLGLPHRVLRDAKLGWDVDLPEDLEFPLPCS